jgi:hypothetical protein
MAFVGVSLTVGTAVGLSGTAAIIGGGALIGAGVGGLYSAVTGDGDILNSMLTGGLLGGAGAFGLNAMGVGAGATTAAGEAAAAAGATGAGTVGPAATVANTSVPALTGANTPAGAALANAAADPIMAAANMSGMTAAEIAAASKPIGGAVTGLTGNQMLGYGLAGTAGMQLLGGRNPKGAIAPASATDPGNIRPYEFSPNQMASGDFPSPYATAQYNAAGIPIMDTRERNYFDQKYTAQTPYSARSGTLNPNVQLPTSGIANAANGGIMRNYDDELGKDETFLDQGNMQKGLFGLGYAHGGIARFANGGSSNPGFLGYGQTEDKPVGRPNPVGEYLVNSILGNPASPSAAVLGGGSSGTESSSSSSSPAESNPILRAMYDKQIENPDYQFTQPELVSGYQALNPNAFSYNQSAKKYSAANPNEQQLSSFKQQVADYMAQDRARKEQEQAAAQSMQSYDGGGGGANGGLMPYDLGGYSDGGRLLRGPGDGVSDDIPATIAGKQPARLADGEFVIPARIVSELGNGSTDAGAKRLYAMMDKIQSGRKKTVGKGNIAKDTKAKKHLLA